MSHTRGILLVALIGGCGPITVGPGHADFSADLPNGYFIYRSSAHQISIMSHRSNHANEKIPAKVVELDHDDDFLIAKQQHLRRRSPGDSNDTYEEPDPGVFSYWILNLQEQILSGPMTSEEFQQQRAELGVADSLTLHDVDDYRPRQP